MADSIFIVAFKDSNGHYRFFVQEFFLRRGKEFLRHTTEVEKAQRFSYPAAEKTVNKLGQFFCTGRIERISEQNHRETLPNLL